MSRLHQMQLRFDPHQDRAILHLRTIDQCEYLFWLTRRFVKLPWQLMTKIVENDAQVSGQAKLGNKRTVLAFQHQQAVEASDFKTRYAQDSAQRPLGDTPVLLARLQLKKDPRDADFLAMSALRGEGVELRLDQRTVHSLCKLLSDVSKTAEWDLSLSMSPLPHRVSAEQIPAKLN